MDLRQITVPTPLDIGPVNLYLIRHDPLTLIDAGPKHPDSWRVLREGLKTHGVRLGDIRRLVLTHSHEDHFGQACAIQEESGCQILIHPWELANIIDRAEYGRYRALLQICGVPQDVVENFEQAYLGLQQFCDQVKQASQVQDGALLDFESGCLQVIHTPGHTPGSICLLNRAHRILITGDTVLDKISPNPLLNPDPRRGEGESGRAGEGGTRGWGDAGTRGVSLSSHPRVPVSPYPRVSPSPTHRPSPLRRFPALAAYLDSLKKLEDSAPVICWTSHGKPVHDFAAYRRDMEAFVAARRGKILALLNSAQWTCWLLSLQAFPDATGVHRFLALSEITSHLDYAQSLGKARVELRDGVEFWSNS